MRAFGLLPFLVAAGACIPGRDNPLDPAISPAAALRVVDLTQAGACPPEGADLVALATSANGVATAGRRRCLALDAHLSTDPQDTTPDRYEFFLPDEADPFESGEIPVALLPTSYRLSVAAETPLEFRVRAYDAGGARGERTASFTFANTRPTAAVPPPRVLPVGGFPWSSATTWDVEFDGTGSADADGDALSYCWSFSHEPAPRACSTSAGVVSTGVPLEKPARVLATLQVSDASGAESFTRQTEVAVSHENLFIEDRADYAPMIVRLDSELSVLPTTMNAGPRAAVLGTAIAISYTYGGLTCVVDVAPWPALQPFTDGPFSPAASYGPNCYGINIAPDAARGRLIAHLEYYGRDEIRTFDMTAGSLVETGSLVVTTNGTGFTYGAIAVTADGTIWTAREQAGSALYTLQIPGDTAPLDGFVREGRILTGLATRPGTGEMWAGETRDYPNGSVSGEPAKLAVYEDRVSPPHMLDLGERDLVFGPAWVDAERFWLVSEGEGLFLLDALALLDGVPFDAAVLQFLPDVLDARNIFVTPVSGTAWLSGSDHVAYRATVDGDVDLLEIDLPYVFGVDATGAVFGGYSTPSTGYHVRRGLTMGDDTVLAREIFATGDAAFDPLTGGFWISAAGPNALIHRAADGSTLGHFPTMRNTDSNQIEPAPALRALRVSPDGSMALGVEYTSSLYTLASLVEVDLSGPLPTFRRVPNVTFAQLTGFVRGTGIPLDDLLMFEPSGPFATESFVWAFEKTVPRIVRRSLADYSELPNAYAMPPEETGTFLMSPAAASDRLCYAAYNNNPSRLAVRRLSPSSATAEVLGAPSLTSQSAFVRTVTSTRNAAGDGEECWVAYEVFNGGGATGPVAAAMITGWSPAAPGSPYRSLDLTTLTGIIPIEGIVSMHASGPDRTWVVVRRTTGDLALLRLDWTGASATATIAGLSERGSFVSTYGRSP